MQKLLIEICHENTRILFYFLINISTVKIWTHTCNILLLNKPIFNRFLKHKRDLPCFSNHDNFILRVTTVQITSTLDTETKGCSHLKFIFFFVLSKVTSNPPKHHQISLYPIKWLGPVVWRSQSAGFYSTVTDSTMCVCAARQHANGCFHFQPSHRGIVNTWLSKSCTAEHQWL